MIKLIRKNLYIYCILQKQFKKSIKYKIVKGKKSKDRFKIKFKFQLTVI